jgi:hypothetical protein
MDLSLYPPCSIITRRTDDDNRDSQMHPPPPSPPPTKYRRAESEHKKGRMEGRNFFAMKSFSLEVSERDEYDNNNRKGRLSSTVSIPLNASC